MFKRKKGIRLSYAAQGLIYFNLINFKILPKAKRDRVLSLINEIGGAYADALFEFLTNAYKNYASIEQEFVVSRRKLFDMRNRFYIEAWKENLFVS